MSFGGYGDQGSAATNGIATCIGILFAIPAAPFIKDSVFTVLRPELMPLYGQSFGDLASWLIVILLTYITFFGVKATLIYSLKLIGALLGLLIAR